ncbi:MAG TPA: sialidase family protein [Terriglobales bacterium]|nr:sialidase family protein [Terriglobales bacterium]
MLSRNEGTKLWRLALTSGLSAIIIFAISCGSSSNLNSTSSNPFASDPPATVPLTQLSSDTFTNASSQHATEVEPGSFSFGSTIITSFQVARISGGGGADIGYAISNDSGATWQNGLLPGITTFKGGGSNSAVSDTVVIYDAKHGVWMISSLPISATNIQVAVSRSSDGGTSWGNPVIVAQGADLDKDWISCDNTPTSPHYGNCYAEWDDNGSSNLIYMSTSSDGGLTWSSGLAVSATHGLGGQPLAQPGGAVIVPFLADAGVIQSFSSTDGGATWGTVVQIATVSDHAVAGGLRSDALPSAQEDAAGNVYVVWQDCRFRTDCASNDLVMSTSANGTNWTQPARIPIDDVSSTADHFIPGLGIDPATAASTAHLGLTYYYYPQANCTAATCALYAGFISSADGGSTWSAATPVAGPMALSWLPSTDSGQMVADYIATSFAGGNAYGFFAVAKAKSGSTFNEAIYTTQMGFNVAAAEAKNNSAGERPVEIASIHADARKNISRKTIRR